MNVNFVFSKSLVYFFIPIWKEIIFLNPHVKMHLTVTAQINK
jgi:hypothetical protein